MAQKMFFAAILSVAILAVHGMSEGEFGQCKITSGVSSFSLQFVCGKSFYTLFASENVERQTCQVSQFVCYPDGRITQEIVTLVNGVQQQPKEVHKLTEITKGQWKREIPADIGVSTVSMNEYVMAWGINKNGSMTLSTFVCDPRSKDEGVSKRFIFASDWDNSVEDEVKNLKKLLQSNGLYAIPTACHKPDFFPGTMAQHE